VEVVVIVRPHTKRINSRIDEAERRVAVGNRLLIDKSHVSGPHGGRKTSAAVFVCSASGLVGANIKVKIGFRGDVRGVAQSNGALVGRGDHTRELLPGRNWKGVRRIVAAATVGPSGFRIPGAARADGLQVRAAHHYDIRIIRWKNIRGRGGIGSAIAGRLKETLTLRRELLEVGVIRAGVRRLPGPGRAQLRT